MPDTIPPPFPPRSRLNLPTMIGLTVVYLALGSLSVMFGLLGFMAFDAGVTPQAVTMFILSWSLPVSFFAGLGLAWGGYGFRWKWLTITGLALPLLAVLLIGGFIVVAILSGS